MSPFPARYPGWCQTCGERISEGESISMTDDGAVHEDCAAPAAPVVEKVCPRCFLTSCDCDR